MRPAPTAIVMLFAAATVAAPAAAGERVAVVEMFTSQGCSSCPPADVLLGRLAQDEDILALSFSVDYWDYLNWKDTLADPAFTARQKGYSKARGDRAVYTPQAVVNGAAHVVGSREVALRKAIEENGGALAGPDLELSWNSDEITVTAGAAPPGSKTRSGTLWLVIFVDEETVKIGDGENAGRTITYHNVARRLEPIGAWNGQRMSVNVAMPNDGGLHCAVFLQEGGEKKPGRILAAARL